MYWVQFVKFLRVIVSVAHDMSGKSGPLFWAIMHFANTARAIGKNAGDQS